MPTPNVPARTNPPATVASPTPTHNPTHNPTPDLPQVLVEGGKPPKQTRLRAADALELERWLGGLPPVVAAEDAVEMPSGRGGGRTSSFIRASKALDRLSRA